jgi:Terminase large subunit, T4likevirus-type, N-terminal/Terminase RNaseH-like domain
MPELTLSQRLRPQHTAVFRSEKRFKIVVAGRRWGKSWLGLWWLVVMAFSQPNRNCYYLAPNYRQAKRIAWLVLKQFIPPALRRRTSEQELFLELHNGSMIQLHGGDRPDCLRGVGLDAVVLDEYAFCDPDLWPMVIRPMLADRRGQALFISTPNSLNHFYDLYTTARTRTDWDAFRYRTADGGYVGPNELAALGAEMDGKRYAQEFEASFETLQTRVYYAFDRECNLSQLEFSPSLPILIGMDFNVNPMTAVVAQKVGYQCHVIDEIVLKNSNTVEMMQEINRRYPPGEGREGAVHPDPSGAARKTSAPVGETDFHIIEQFGWPVYRMKQYPVIDRINTVNAKLCDANDLRHLFISPKCTQLIRALDGLTYKEGTKLVDKSSGLDHIADALGYLIMGLFSIYQNTVSITTQLI